MLLMLAAQLPSAVSTAEQLAAGHLAAKSSPPRGPWRRPHKKPHSHGSQPMRSSRMGSVKAATSADVVLITMAIVMGQNQKALVPC